MSHLREHDANTQLMPVMFRNGLDRRASARIPLSGLVRMGAPSSDPYANVSARDVSAGGLFIDADRPVKIGARFSTEIQLGTGERIYIPEAEVAYNREHASGSGFGVRFVDPPLEVVEAIEREIEKAREAVARVPTLPPVSTFEVLEARSIEPAPSASKVIAQPAESKAIARPVESKRATKAKSIPPKLAEPEVVEEPKVVSRAKTDEEPKVVSRAKTDEEPKVVSRAKADEEPKVLSRAKTDDEPKVVSRAKADEAPKTIEAKVVSRAKVDAAPKSIVPVLVEARKDENATEILVRDTLPPLPREPMIDDDSFDVDSRMPEEEPAWWEDWMRVGHDLKTRVLERSRRFPLLWTALAITGSVLVVSAIGLALWSGTSAEAVEPVAVVDRGVTSGTHQALMGDQQMPDVVVPKRVAQALEPAPAETKKPLPPLVYVEDVEKKAAAEVKKQQPVPAKDIEKPKATAATKSSRNVKTKIGLASGARVLKTHVLKAPDRFVIDVVGQDKAPALPGASGAIKSIRFGKHPDFARIVVETSRPIDNGRASKKGGELAVALELR